MEPTQESLNPTAQAGGQPAGWYPDPANPASLRWWDGSQWTDHHAPAMTRIAEVSDRELRLDGKWAYRPAEP